MAPTDVTLRSGFIRSALEHPSRPALVAAGETLSYSELHHRAASLAVTLERAASVEAARLTAVFAARSSTAFAGVLGALLRGHGYVPLNPSFPVDRLASMLSCSGAREVVVGAEAAPLAADLLSSRPDPLVVLLPDLTDVADLRARLPQHQVLGRGDLAATDGHEPAPVCANAVAYLLFTSGSTGTPKGVAVLHRNVTPVVELMAERYRIQGDDRVSQTFDMSFDLSVFDMFVAWERGACLCCPSVKELIAPASFIRKSELTVWFSVPSVAVFMRQLGMLKPGAYPTLRWSLFCGEALPASVAEAFAAAAPNSVVENLYGPTEATIACMVYRWDPVRSPAESAMGVVPIGEPLPGMSAHVVDDHLREVAPGEVGELLVSGRQVAPGYWQDPNRTAASFVRPPGTDQIHYRTGDRVRRPPADGTPLVYLGRRDHQVKVLGHRVELGEVEAALREATGVDAVIAVGWPPTDSGAGGVAAFVADVRLNVDELRAAMATRLPDYMVPRRIELLTTLPRNVNGKYDRRALFESLGRAK